VASNARDSHQEEEPLQPVHLPTVLSPPRTRADSACLPSSFEIDSGSKPKTARAMSNVPAPASDVGQTRRRLRQSVLPSHTLHLERDAHAPQNVASRPRSVTMSSAAPSALAHTSASASVKSNIRAPPSQPPDVSGEATNSIQSLLDLAGGSGDDDQLQWTLFWGHMVRTYLVAQTQGVVQIVFHQVHHACCVFLSYVVWFC
jgi:hypothetical protein